jgi:hypothetical protein
MKVRSTRKRLALAGLLALAFGVVGGTGSAQAAKVTESAAGGLVPPTIDGGPGLADSRAVFTQSFKLSGKNAKGKQVLDVNVTVNGVGSGDGSNDDLNAQLIAPNGDNTGIPIPDNGSAMSNLEFDDQSILRSCNPLTFNSDDCNYVQGAVAGLDVGTVTGELNASFNPVFRGNNPKGTWRIQWIDVNSNAITTTLGETTLEVKTGKKFAKD